MQKRKNDVKARTTLLLSLPDEHQLRFSKYKTAQELWAAILKTFDGNEATKKTKKNLLKQQYGKFKAKGSKTLKQAFINCSSGSEEVNIASVSTASTNVSTVSANIRVASNSQDTACAYIASQSSGSQIKFEDINQIDEDGIEEMDIKWNMALLSMRTDRFWKKTGKKISIQGIDVAGFDKSKVECFNCHKMGHFARECRAPRSQDRGRRDNYRQGSKVEEQASKALMAIDGVGWTRVIWRMMKIIMHCLLESQRLDKNKEGLGYSDVPPPLAQVYSPPKKDLSWTGLLELADDTVTDYSRLAPTIETTDRSTETKTAKVETAKPAVKYAAMYKNHQKVLMKFPTGNTKFSPGDLGGCKITGKGTIKTGKLEFENVYFVKDLKDFKVLDDANVLLRTPRQHNMYSINLNNIVPHKDLTCLVVKASADEGMLWHRRLSHLNFKTMNRLVRHNLVRGLPSKCFENDHNCTACLKGKQHKVFCKSKLVNSVTKPLHTLHMDLFGPTSVSSISHKWNCLVVTDDFSRFTWTFFLKTKDETSGILRKFITKIENLKDQKVKIIRCDNGGEFRNKEMDDFCSQKGIKKAFSNARTPQQNGVAERRNRTLIEAARTMLADAKLPVTFWAEAVNTACYVQNRVLVNKSHNKTPYELFNGRSPTIGFLKPFGCHVMIFNTLDHLGKFEAKGDEEGTKILATIDGKLRTVSESSISRNLKLNDEAGISSLPDAKLFENLQLGEGSGTPTESHHTPSPEVQPTSPTTHSSSSLPPITIAIIPPVIPTALLPTVIPSDNPPLRQYTRRTKIAQSSVLPPIANEHASPLGDDSQGKACSTNSGFEVDQDRVNIAKTSTLPSDSTPRVTSLAVDEGSMQHKLDELMALCTSQQRQQSEMVSKFEAQELEINSLKARIKLLEDKNRGVADQSRDDAPIKGRRLDEGEEAAERFSDDTEEMATVLTFMDAASILTSGGVQVVPTAAEVATATVKSTSYTRRKGKEKMVESDTPKKKKLQEQIDVRVARELEEQMAREDQRMSEQIARDAETKDFKGMSFEQIEAKFNTVWKKIEDFIPMGSKEEAERLKRKGLRLEQESVKKLKTSKEFLEEVKSSEEVPEEKVKDMMQLVPIEEVYVEALQVKHPIIDWKVYTEGQRSFWKIIKLGGSSVSYQFFMDMLKHLDREDLNQLWELVKETLNIRPADSDKEMELWVELKRLYEPDVEDQLWTHTQNPMHAPVEWKLHDTCEVHHVTSKDKEIFMLVEKAYPLRKGLAIIMKCYKLQVENYSQMANDLILKIYKITNSPRQQDD
nr:putative ribonuclease H-like domain-containing protein [Tanacetum cinerariifolium]